MSGIGGLGATGADKEAKDKRKMTQGILEDAKEQKDTYAFLEDDDDFEEFEDDDAGDRGAGFDVNFNAAADKKQW